MSEVPASHTRPLDAAGMVLVVLICLTWGFNQPAIKLAIHDVPPLTQCAIRSSLATLIVFGLMRLRGLRSPPIWHAGAGLNLWIVVRR